MQKVVSAGAFLGLLLSAGSIFGYSNHVFNKSGNKIEVKWKYHGEVKGFSCTKDKRTINNDTSKAPYAGGCQLAKLIVTDGEYKTVVRVKTIMPKWARTKVGKIEVSELIDIERIGNYPLEGNPLDELKVGSYGSTKWVYRGYNNLMPAQKDSGVAIFDQR